MLFLAIFRYDELFVVKKEAQFGNVAHYIMWRTQEKFRGGFKVMAGIVWGSRSETPGGRRIYENLQKNFIWKLQKYIILAYLKKFTNHTLVFLRVWRKNTIGWQIFDKILKIFDED